MKRLKRLFGIEEKEVSRFEEYRKESKENSFMKEELGKLINIPTTNREVLDILYKIRNIIYK